MKPQLFEVRQIVSQKPPTVSLNLQVLEWFLRGIPEASYVELFGQLCTVSMLSVCAVPGG